MDQQHPDNSSENQPEKRSAEGAHEDHEGPHVPSADLFGDLQTLQEIAHTGNVDQLEAHLSALNPADLLSEFAGLDADDQARVLAVLAPRHAGQLLEQLPDAQAADALSELDPEDAAAVLDSLDSRGRADLIANLASHQARAVLRQMREPLAKEARSLAKYRPNEAGGMMATEFLACIDTATIGEVLASLRESFEQFTDLDVQYIYCTSEFGDLVGVLRLRDLIMRRPD
ncbi:MAG TPA: hypothetical protein VG711_13155, partial [Phycisphaerales bacterium]|nr:hypothetical protein [Phycisphaerales bacterium]